MNGEGNRYLTPFEDIIPIKFASRCQKARAMSSYLLQMFMREQEEDRPVVSYAAKECQGKKRYPTNTEAGAAVGRRRDAILVRTGDTTSLIGLHPYKCTQCGGWHIGHRPGSNEKIKRVREERGMK